GLGGRTRPGPSRQPVVRGHRHESDGCVPHRGRCRTRNDRAWIRADRDDRVDARPCRSSGPGRLEHVSFGEFLEAGQRSGELEKGSKVLTVTFVAHRQPAIAAQPSQGAFDLPPVTAEAFAAVDAATGDPRNDAPGPQPPAVYGIVVTLVRPHPAGSAAARTAR